MSTPQRDAVLKLAEWLEDEVEGFQGLPFYAEEPISPDRPCVTVWWENAAPNPDRNTVGVVGGWLGNVEVFGIRYVEPAPDQGRLLKNEARGQEIEEMMNQAVACVFNHTTELPSYGDLRWTGHARLAPSEGFLFTGFEISCQAQREIAYS